MKRLILLVVCLFLKGGTMLWGDELCRFAEVTWKDAVVYNSTGGTLDLNDFDKLLATVHSLGCVLIKERHIVIIHSITNGKVDDFLAIPKEWAIKITFLKEAENDSPSDKPLAPVVKADADDNLDVGAVPCKRCLGQMRPRAQERRHPPRRLRNQGNH